MYQALHQGYAIAHWCVVMMQLLMLVMLLLQLGSHHIDAGLLQHGVEEHHHSVYEFIDAQSNLLLQQLHYFLIIRAPISWFDCMVDTIMP